MQKRFVVHGSDKRVGKYGMSVCCMQSNVYMKHYFHEHLVLLIALVHISIPVQLTELGN